MGIDISINNKIFLVYTDISLARGGIGAGFGGFVGGFILGAIAMEAFHLITGRGIISAAAAVMQAPRAIPPYMEAGRRGMARGGRQVWRMVGTAPGGMGTLFPTSGTMMAGGGGGTLLGTAPG
jgi:hypothetical protein